MRRASWIAGLLLTGASIGFGQAPGDAGAAKPGPAPETPETWGTAYGYASVMGYELTRENGIYLQKEPGRSFCPNESASSIAQAAIGQFQIPDGARIDEMDIWAFDSDPDYFLTFDLLEFCQAVGFNGPIITGLATAMTTGSAGGQYIASPVPGHTVNNRDCAYSVRVVFAPATLPCRFDRLQVQKIALRYTRQVSPPPATASFADVPLDHPLSQFVEALAKSGITGGCGGGNFCPDNPLTRGQMAVFLAKGLGLSWP